MVMWGHFFCCQGFSNINFNDLLEVNKPHFSGFKVCTYAWRSPPLGGLLPLVGSWRTGLPVACSARLCLECCAVWIPSFYELCPLLPRQGQTSGSELRGKERQSDRSKRSQMILKQQTAAPGWLVFTLWFWIHPNREKTLSSPRHPCQVRLLLLSHFSRGRLCATPSLGFSRQEHWSGLPFPSPVHKSESEIAQSCLTHLDPVDCSLPGSSVHGIFQARVLEWGAIAFSAG